MQTFNLFDKTEHLLTYMSQNTVTNTLKLYDFSLNIDTMLV